MSNPTFGLFDPATLKKFGNAAMTVNFIDFGTGKETPIAISDKESADNVMRGLENQTKFKVTTLDASLVEVAGKCLLTDPQNGGMIILTDEGKQLPATMNANLTDAELPEVAFIQCIGVMHEDALVIVRAAFRELNLTNEKVAEDEYAPN